MKINYMIKQLSAVLLLLLVLPSYGSPQLCMVMSNALCFIGPPDYDTIIMNDLPKFKGDNVIFKVTANCFPLPYNPDNKKVTSPQSIQGSFWSSNGNRVPLSNYVKHISGFDNNNLLLNKHNISVNEVQISPATGKRVSIGIRLTSPTKTEFTAVCTFNFERVVYIN